MLLVSPAAAIVPQAAAPAARTADTARVATSSVPPVLQLRFADGGATSSEAARSTSAAARERLVRPVPTVPPGSPGAYKVVTGDLYPRHVAFEPVKVTPAGHSVWRVMYGMKYVGGLVGETEDIEFQILDREGNGSIDSAGAFAGTLDGLEGGFIFESEGKQSADGTFTMNFDITPGTGYGKLTGVTGSFTVVATRAHCDPRDTPETCETLVSYTLAYRLP
ncbi:DUF3224 domain-containing protein [Micromonospora craniellae]|uniref:DUF3224 domain-containing protein n=1 Tax=Micromonospora craniellae TaxID=2294034 RepID=UPI0013141A39|nr:DUF3224 domain-containing protein [Micromonospora craniellae]QOC91732.1 DUF3224 domain-containing protein [Micromonospora craniellae]